MPTQPRPDVAGPAPEAFSVHIDEAQELGIAASRLTAIYKLLAPADERSYVAALTPTATGLTLESSIPRVNLPPLHVRIAVPGRTTGTLPDDAGRVGVLLDQIIDRLGTAEAGSREQLAWLSSPVTLTRTASHHALAVLVPGATRLPLQLVSPNLVNRFAPDPFVALPPTAPEEPAQPAGTSQLPEPAAPTVDTTCGVSGDDLLALAEDALREPGRDARIFLDSDGVGLTTRGGGILLADPNGRTSLREGGPSAAGHALMANRGRDERMEEHRDPHLSLFDEPPAPTPVQTPTPRRATGAPQRADRAVVALSHGAAIASALALSGETAEAQRALRAKARHEESETLVDLLTPCLALGGETMRADVLAMVRQELAYERLIDARRDLTKGKGAHTPARELSLLQQVLGEKANGVILRAFGDVNRVSPVPDAATDSAALAVLQATRRREAGGQWPRNLRAYAGHRVLRQALAEAWGADLERTATASIREHEPAVEDASPDPTTYELARLVAARIAVGDPASEYLEAIVAPAIARVGLPRVVARRDAVSHERRPGVLQGNPPGMRPAVASGPRESTLPTAGEDHALRSLYRASPATREAMYRELKQVKRGVRVANTAAGIVTQAGSVTTIDATPGITAQERARFLANVARVTDPASEANRDRGVTAFTVPAQAVQHVLDGVHRVGATHGHGLPGGDVALACVYVPALDPMPGRPDGGTPDALEMTVFGTNGLETMRVPVAMQGATPPAGMPFIVRAAGLLQDGPRSESEAARLVLTHVANADAWGQAAQPAGAVRYVTSRYATHTRAADVTTAEPAVAAVIQGMRNAYATVGSAEMTVAAPYIQEALAGLATLRGHGQRPDELRARPAAAATPPSAASRAPLPRPSRGGR